MKLLITFTICLSIIFAIDKVTGVDILYVFIPVVLAWLAALLLIRRYYVASTYDYLKPKTMKRRGGSSIDRRAANYTKGI